MGIVGEVTEQKISVDNPPKDAKVVLDTPKDVNSKEISDNSEDVETPEEPVLVPFVTDGAAYVYTQTPDSLTVVLQVIPDIKTSDIVLDTTETGISLKIRGLTVLRVRLIASGALSCK